MIQLNQQITATMAALNISKAELSRRLGKKRGYLNEVQRVGCSTGKQAELIAKIQRVAEGNIILSDEQAFDAMCKTAQNRADRILELERINDTIDSENDELRETVRIQGMQLEQANWNTDFLANRMPTTAMAAFVLFIKLLFGGSGE